MKTVAVVTCSELLNENVDVSIMNALSSMEVNVSRVAWDDANVVWSDFDCAILRSTWDYTDRLDEFLSWARRISEVCVLINPIKVVEWNTKKSYLRVLEQEDGVRIIPTVWIIEEGIEDLDLEQIMREKCWKRGFVKPIVGATSRGTLRFDVDDKSSLEHAEEHIRKLLPQEKELLLQPYLSQVESEGELSVIFINGEHTHCVRKVPQKGDFRVQIDFGGVDSAVVLPDDVVEEAKRIVASSEKHVGERVVYARVDFIRGDDDEMYVTEVELVEPCLFFHHCISAADKLAHVIVS